MQQLAPVKKIREILARSRRIAVVGLSPKPARPSNQVAAYLLQAGYEVIPVNPGHEQILGRTCYPDLLSVPGPIDLVDIFRRPEDVLPVVRAAIDKQVKAVWMQQGIINKEAAVLAEQAGITVIMDRCIMVDHQQFMG
ncbi:MAG: CoA-binding protein [Desulfobulbus sp.]|jgi:predicted CoA-binding protein|nr:MAG: CoA-binding protein [Desulfobulbus sp.]